MFRFDGNFFGGVLGPHFFDFFDFLGHFNLTLQFRWNICSFKFFSGWRFRLKLFLRPMSSVLQLTFFRLPVCFGLWRVIRNCLQFFYNKFVDWTIQFVKNQTRGLFVTQIPHQGRQCYIRVVFRRANMNVFGLFDKTRKYYGWEKSKKLTFCVLLGHETPRSVTMFRNHKLKPRNFSKVANHRR